MECLLELNRVFLVQGRVSFGDDVGLAHVVLVNAVAGLVAVVVGPGDVVVGPGDVVVGLGRTFAVTLFAAPEACYALDARGDVVFRL